MNDSNIEIIKAYSVLWRTSPECCSRPSHEKCSMYDKCDNDPIDFLRLSETEQSALNEWIDYALEPSDDYICPDSSYGIKHIYERDMGKYVTNGQFKGAMIHYGFDPINPRELNCYYRIKIRFDVLEKTSHVVRVMHDGI